MEFDNEFTIEVENNSERLESVYASYETLLSDAKLQLDQFEINVRSAIQDPSHQKFRNFLRGCVQAELTEAQTIRVLGVCRDFEHRYLTAAKLLNYPSGAELRRIQNNINQSLQTARVAVLLGVVYYLGAGITRDLQLALQYFKFSESMQLRDASLMVAYMIKRGHAKPQNTDDKENFERACQYFQQSGEADPLQQAIFCTQFPRNVPVLTAEWVNQPDLALESAELDTAEVYPGQLAQSALALIQSLAEPSSNAPVLTLAHKKDRVIEAARLLYRAHETFLRTTTALAQRKIVAVLMASLYESNRLAYKNNEALKIVHETAIYAQYYYALTDPGMYESFCTSADEPEQVLTCILNDPVSSSRAKMRRIIALVGSVPSYSLYSGVYQTVENLGHLAYQALDDTLALISYCELAHEQELLKEAREYQIFAQSILDRLSGRVNRSYGFNGVMVDNNLFNPNETLKAHEPFFTRLRRKSKALGFDRSKQMVMQGPAGLARAFQYLMGSELGSKQLALTKNPDYAEIIIKLLTELKLPPLLTKSKDFLAKLKIQIIKHVPLSQQEAYLDQQFESCLDILGFLPIASDLNEGLLIQFQDFVYFCSLIEDAKLPSSCPRQPSEELFKLFSENRQYLLLIEEGIKLYQSPAYLPSKMNIFSSTYGKTKEHGNQLMRANLLHTRCEWLIFNKVDILCEIEKFMVEAIEEQHVMNFALVLMKVMTQGANPFLPSDYFDLKNMQERHKKNPSMIFREFCDGFKECFLQSSVLSSDEDDQESEDDHEHLQLVEVEGKSF